MITATGRTFEHRDTIRALGGWWNNADRCWQFDHLSSSQITRLRGLVGVMVVDHGTSSRPEPVDDDEDDEPITSLIDRILGRDGPRPTVNQTSAIYGDDPTYHNHFADQNAAAYFGFSSLETFASYIEHLPPSITNDPRRSGWEIDDGDWRGSRRMSDALRLAREGWQEGLERAADVVERLSLANPRVKRRHPALAGGSVSVGRMLAGDPAHMIRRPKMPGRKVVTFFVEAGYSGFITADSMVDRAALIGAMIDLMENVGYSCNVITVDTSIYAEKPIYQLAVCLKNAGERLNLADIVFALGHPAFSRRMSFAAQTSVVETRDSWAGIGEPRNAFDQHHPCGRSEFYVPVLRQNGTDDPLDLIPLVVPENLPIKIERD